jgi:hypothetical protein
MMERDGLNPDEAFESLRHLQQAANRKVVAEVQDVGNTSFGQPPSHRYMVQV